MEEIKSLISSFFKLAEGLKIDSEEKYEIIMSVCSIQANLDFELTSRSEMEVKKELTSYIDYLNK